MNSPSCGAAPILRLSSRDLPEQERLPVFQDIFARSAFKIAVEPQADAQPFECSMVAVNLPGCQLAWASNNVDTDYRRTPALLTDSSDDLIFSITLNGAARVRQCGREAVTGPGDALLGSAAELGCVTEFGEARYLNICLPLKPIKQMAPNVEDRIATRIGADNPALRLLTHHLAGLQQGELVVATPRLAQTAADYIRDLVGLMLGATGDAAEQAAQGGVRAARLAQIHREIQHSALNAHFSLPELALRVGVAPRYVQKLLAEEETSFVKEVMRCRLEHAKRLLRSPPHRRVSITEIAWQSGFETPHYFHRLFRKTFGVTPGEMREGAVT
jgi:AraC-like DNA-binding protein